MEVEARGAGSRTRSEDIEMRAERTSDHGLISRLRPSRLFYRGKHRCHHCWVRPNSACAELNTLELQEIENLGREERFASKATLFSEEQRATEVYSLTQGVVRLYKLLPDGRRQIVGFALPGEFLGLTPSDCYNFSADAITPIVVCRFSRNEFSRFAETRPSMLRGMNELGNRELDHARSQIVLLGRHSAEQRVAMFLIGWRGRLTRLGDVSETIPLPMKRRDIADFLGMTVETVSRTLTRLERENVLSIVRDGIRIRDLARAEALACG